MYGQGLGISVEHCVNVMTGNDVSYRPDQKACHSNRMKVGSAIWCGSAFS